MIGSPSSQCAYNGHAATRAVQCLRSRSFLSAWSLHERSEIDRVMEVALRAAKAKGVAAEVYTDTKGPADVIIDAATAFEADLIVVGNKGMSGAKRFLLGSVPNRVSHHAPCSVLIIRTT